MNKTQSTKIQIH